MPQTHLTATRFDQFDLHPQILAGLDKAGFEFCTPIQAETLPIALAGQDVAGQAQTGTGKTAAFLLVALQRLLLADAGAASPVDDAAEDQPTRAGQPRVLILAPTRELAVQIHKDAELLAAHTGYKLAAVYGGTGYQSQRDDLIAGVDILIGTPGRMIDYLKQRVFDLQQVDVVILDEADRMFDLGFIKDIRFILRRMPNPTQRLGMLFSATLSYRVMELAYEHMNDPKMVEIMPERVTADRVTQQAYMVANEEKIPLLIGLLRRFEGARSMVFVNTKREGERVWGYLEGNGLPAAMLSGDVPQKKRLSLLKRFQGGDLSTMVATDVAARGLHIPGVTHVINYDLPEDPEDYVHRIGRTARAGAAGDAISFVCESYAMGWPDIEAFVGLSIPMTTPEADMLAEVDSRSRIRVERAERRPRPGSGGPRGRSGGVGRGPGRGSESAANSGGDREARGGASPDERRRRRRGPARGTPPHGDNAGGSAADEADARGTVTTEPVAATGHPPESGAGLRGASGNAAPDADKSRKRRRRRSRNRAAESPSPAPES
jgi:ATP-dependent RNA helicase RhlB